MRITDLEILVLGTAGRNLTFLKLFTDEGFVGISEARLATGTEALSAYLRAVKHRYIVGTDPFETEKLVDRMDSGDQGRVGVIEAAAIALVEVACWDLKGKALNVPVYRLLGGAVRDRIKACAAGWQTRERTPDAFARAARGAVAQGYRALKFDPFGTARHELPRAELHAALGLCEAVRAAVGPDVEIFIDMQGRFLPATAVQAARALERIDPSGIAEPVSAANVPALAWVARQTDIPVAAGAKLYHRHDFRELCARRACAIIQPDLTHCRGLSEACKIAALAEMHALFIAPRNVGGPVATAANLHLSATLTHFLIQENENDFEAAVVLQGGLNQGKTGNLVKEAVSGCPEVIDGDFVLPQGPGLGVTLCEDLIRAHPMKSE